MSRVSGKGPTSWIPAHGLLSKLSIKRKLVLIIMLVCCIATLLAGLSLLIYQLFAFRESMVSDLSAQGYMIELSCAPALEFEYPNDAEEVLESLQAIPAIEMACLYRADGSVFAEFIRAGAERIEPPPPERMGTPHFYGTRLVLFREILCEGKAIGTLYLQSDLKELLVLTRNSVLMLGLILLLSSVFAFLLAAILQRLISSPILALEDTARIVTITQDYSPRATKQSEDELGRLTEAFNDMLAQIENRDDTLRQLRNLLSNIISSMPSVLIAVDSDGKIMQWNREAERATGISASVADRQPLAQVFPDLAKELDKVRQAVIDGKPQKEEKVVRMVDGEPRYLDVTVYPLRGAEGAVIRVDDVTERVRIEEVMIQSEKMLSVGGLAAGMAHEINNPLAGIIQNVQVLRNRISADLAKNQEAAEQCGTAIDTIVSYIQLRGIPPILESIMASGERAAEIIDNMLSFSRKGGSYSRPHDLATLLDRTVELASNDYDLKSNYDFRKIAIVREYDPATPPVPCEAPKIQQVFLNLLKNSAQAMVTDRDAQRATGGRPRFILRLQPDGDMVRIDVEDNGAGMDEETRKRVFEPFFTTKDTGIGTGLGLSVSYFIITENHNGTMAVESTPGRGTKFVIHLPVERNA